jgi:hypothetical protein
MHGISELVAYRQKSDRNGSKKIVEELTFNHGVLGSSPSGLTT